MFISDGCCSKTTKQISIGALKQRKIDFNTEMLTKLNIVYTYSKDGQFRISGSKHNNVYEGLLKVGSGALNKHLPDYVWN
jgi:hypothetical protein